MKKRIMPFVVIIALLLATPAYAVSTRLISVVPDIQFNGTNATCMALITANKTTDKISATMELWQDDEMIDSWSGVGYGYLKLEGDATVRRYETYQLTVNYSVNGTMKTPVTIDRTNK